MTTESWDSYLVAEHELIERTMAVLQGSLENIDATANNPVQMLRAVDFLLEFGDKIHNQKEEVFLFPLLEERGISREGGPIGVMLMEHEAERDLLASMQRTAPSLGEADAAIRQKFQADGLEYLRIRAEHIWKENDVLYKMGQRVFSTEDTQGLIDAFTRVDGEVYGEDARRKYEAMVGEMETKAGLKTRLIDKLSKEQLHAILETLPFEVTFVDSNDVVAYFNKLDKKKIFPRTRSVIGRTVHKCHPPKSVATVEAIVQGFKDGTRDKADFWIDFAGDTILIRYFPVRDDAGTYLGVLEVTQNVAWIKALEGQKRLLD